MGYYVELVHSNTVIDHRVKDRVYEIWCALNHSRNNHLKNGGSYSGGGKTAHWYSWMDEHYDQKCKTVEEILDMLGFGYEVLADGSVDVSHYDSKTGQEDLFFKAVAHLLSGQMTWRGEDGAEWTWQFHGKPEVMALAGVQQAKLGR